MQWRSAIGGFANRSTGSSSRGSSISSTVSFLRAQYFCLGLVLATLAYQLLLHTQDHQLVLTWTQPSFKSTATNQATWNPGPGLYFQELSFNSVSIWDPGIIDHEISTLSCKWGTLGLSNNKLLKMINGNRRSLGYKLAVWNCERGLLGLDGASEKLQDIKQFIERKKPHVFGIIETDIFSPKSEKNRISKFDTAAVRSHLNIDIH